MPELIQTLNQVQGDGHKLRLCYEFPEETRGKNIFVIPGCEPKFVAGDGYVISKPTNIKPWMAT
ncbi:MAG TPA: hypothetical protein DCZ76_01605 [Treponema sp.]|nr:hypothetical protein [Treponema sp.]